MNGSKKPYIKPQIGVESVVVESSIAASSVACDPSHVPHEWETEEKTFNTFWDDY